MIKKEIAAKSLTATAAAEFVKIASGFKSEVFILADNKTVNAKSLMGIIALGLHVSQKITLKVEGADEAAAMTALTKFIEKA